MFRLDSKWGPFTVKGSDLLRVRARELAATAALEQIDSAGTLVNAAGRTALKPLATAKDLVTAPGKTLGDTVKGVGNLFGSVDASHGRDRPEQGKLIPSLTGGATARRKLAYDFGVDPNTDSSRSTRSSRGLPPPMPSARLAPMRARLRHRRRRYRHQHRRHQPHLAARAARQDGWAAREGGSPIAGHDGRLAGRDGCIYGNSNLSPTDKANIVASLADLGATSGREIFIAGAADAPSIEIGFFYRRQQSDRRLTRGSPR